MPNLKINFFLKLKKTDEFKINIFWNYFSLIILAISGIAINTLISIYYSANTLGVFNQVLAGYMVCSMFGSGGIK